MTKGGFRKPPSEIHNLMTYIYKQYLFRGITFFYSWLFAHSLFLSIIFANSRIKRKTIQGTESDRHYKHNRFE